MTKLILRIQSDCEKCVNGIRSMDISTKEKKRRIDEIASMVQSAMLSKDDFVQLTKIKEKLKRACENYNRPRDNKIKQSNRIEML